MSVDIEVSDRVATILFNRPGKLNSFTDGMWIQFREHLDRCKQDDEIRAVLLAGQGRGFCAGADISGEGKIIARKPGIAGIQQMMEFYSSIISCLYHLPKPTIAAVHGPTVGIGWTMALCCDWLLTTPSAKFRPAFVNLAKVPEGGFQFLVARQIGAFKARDLIYRSQLISGAEAAMIGLATRLIEEDKLMDEAACLAAEAAAIAPLAFKASKQLFNRSSGDFDAFLQQELQAVAIAASTMDAKEGIAAFVEKRPPLFSGT